MRIDRRLKAFTIMELLVSMTLTGILVAFAFMGYNQVQRLFINYTIQSEFVSDYNQLNKALELLAAKAKTIKAQGDKAIRFEQDSGSVLLDMRQDKILLNLGTRTDTFAMKAKEIRLSFVNTGETTLPPVLLQHMDCEVHFQSQKFRVSFDKAYDARTLLQTTLISTPTDEQP